MVRDTLAAFLVASEVLSTLPSPTSAFTRPVGDVIAGEDNVGEVPNTNAPLPVSSVTAAAKLAEEGVPRNVATPEPKLVIPVPPLATGNVPVVPPSIGNPVALVNVAEDGVPKAGVTSVGELANTNEPVPVSSVTAAAKLALEGVPKKSATPEPKDVIPVPPLATGNVPVIPEASDTLVIVFVAPSIDLFVNVSVEEMVGMLTLSNCNLFAALTATDKSAEFAALRQFTPSVLARRRIPVVLIFVPRDL